MKNKILFIIPTLELGGAEKQQINILNCIDTSKFDVFLIILKNKTQLIEQIKNENIDIIIFNFKSFFDIKEYVKLIKIIKQISPDIIHTQMYNANLLSRFLKIIFPNTKIINHIHGMSKWMNNIKLLIEKLTSRYVDLFIVVSDSSCKLRIKREQYPKDKIVVLYNSVDLNECNQKEKTNEIIIGMASRLIPLKNIKGAMYLCSELIKKGLKIKLVIAGDGPEKENLILHAKELGIRDKVNFLGFCKNMKTFYEQIDVFCISSFTEDLPLSVIEAMYCGKPIIASNVGEIPNLLSNIKCKIIINDFFTKEAVNISYEFLKEINFDKCKAELIKYAKKNFSNKNYCNKLEKIYERLLNEKNSN